MTRIINIAQDYTKFPGGRYPGDGPGNGTTFRTKFLVPALKSGEPIVIQLDGAAGYPSSFLEEAFGGLVRVEKINPEKILSSIKFEANSPGFQRHIPRITSYIRGAGNAAA